MFFCTFYAFESCFRTLEVIPVSHRTHSWMLFHIFILFVFLTWNSFFKYILQKDITPKFSQNITVTCTWLGQMTNIQSNRNQFLNYYRFPLTAYFCFYNITKLHHNMADHILILTYFWIFSQHKQNKTYKLIIGQSKLVSQQNTYHKHLVSSCDSAMCTDH